MEVRFADNPKYQMDDASRCAVKQAGKIRSCDDLRHSRTNRGVRVSSPITLPTWDIIAQQCYIIADSPKELGLGVNDHESAYKHHPVRPDHADLAVVALRPPADGKQYVFAPRAQLFGSVASVMHYNISNRSLVVIANRLLGAPAVGYVDDFAFPAHLSLCPAAVRAFHQMADSIGIKIMKHKRLFGEKNVCLGGGWQNARPLERNAAVFPIPSCEGIK